MISVKHRKLSTFYEGKKRKNGKFYKIPIAFYFSTTESLHTILPCPKSVCPIFLSYKSLSNPDMMDAFLIFELSRFIPVLRHNNLQLYAFVCDMIYARNMHTHTDTLSHIHTYLIF